MWASAAHNPINPTGKMKAYRNKRLSTKASVTGRGPIAICYRSADESGYPRQHWDDRNHSILP